jgi:protein-S-isoprenylcysteine O-methyltransferase Ste14
VIGLGPHIGFLLQWPTFAKLAMFPVLLAFYRRLAMREEREVRAEFGAAYDAFAAATPRFLPHLRALGSAPQTREVGR